MIQLSSWSWNFGDAGISSLQNPTHTYTVGGTYNTTLIVTTAKGCKDTIINSVTVHHQPVAQFNANISCGSLTIPFNDTSTLAVGNIVSWNWDFGDTNTSVQQDPSHTFASANTFNVSLIVTSDKGCTDTSIQALVIGGVNAGFAYTGNCISDGSMFNDTSLAVTGDSVIAWSWNFGDNSFDTIPDVKHYYSGSGVYSVSLVVTTAKGCMDTVTTSITSNPSPVAIFDHDNKAPNELETVNFTDQSTGGATSWYWNMGNGTTFTSQNASYIYETKNDYVITHVVTNSFGCTDTATLSLFVDGIYPISVPSAFTPNGDGRNDILLVKGGPVSELDFKVYNEWGKIVFSSNNQGDGWDGKYKGVDQPVGTYVYVVIATTLNGTTYKLSGDVLLMR